MSMVILDRSTMVHTPSKEHCPGDCGTSILFMDIAVD